MRSVSHQHAEDIGVGLHQRAHHAVDELAVDPPRGHHQHRVARELAGVEALPELLVELRRLLAVGLELALLLVVAGLGPVEVVLEPVELAFEAVDGGVVEEGRAEDETDAEGEQDGGERDDVEAEVDHQPENRERQKARSTSRTGSDSISATASVKAAARIIHTRSMVRTELR